MKYSNMPVEVLNLTNQRKKVDKYEYISSKTHLPKETIQVAFDSLKKQLKDGERKNTQKDKKKNSSYWKNKLRLKRT